MKRILAIGGAVIKTALDELKQAAQKKMFDVLIHNGGSIFHDFQLATELIPYHSHSLDALMINPDLNKDASELLWQWINENCVLHNFGKSGVLAPEGSVTRICETNGIEVMLFTILGGDFWQLFDDRWVMFAYKTKNDFNKLCCIMNEEEFDFICMGSAVIHPEVFTKALAVAQSKKFRGYVVDFMDMYRPKTRIAKYGKYFKMTHQEFLEKWLLEGDKIFD